MQWDHTELQAGRGAQAHPLPQRVGEQRVVRGGGPGQAVVVGEGGEHLLVVPAKGQPDAAGGEILHGRRVAHHIGLGGAGVADEQHQRAPRDAAIYAALEDQVRALLHEETLREVRRSYRFSYRKIIAGASTASSAAFCKGY